MENNRLPQKIIGGILAIPGAKVNRQDFLVKVLSPYVRDKDQLKKIEYARPWSIVSHEALDKIAKERISFRKKLVSTASFAAGLPGGLGLLGAIPADVLQYHYHLLALSQELAYLYGFPEFYDENGDATEETLQALIVMFFGVQAAVGTAAREGAEQLIKMLAQGAPKRIASMKWGKTSLFKAIQGVARWLGVKGGQDLSKKEIGKVVGKVIPVVGGFISAGISYGTFTIDSKRYVKFLREHKELFIEADENREKVKTPN